MTAITPAAPARAQGPFTSRAAIGMALVGVAAALAFMGLTAAAPDLRPPDGGAHALSKSAVGYAGLVRLLKEGGAPVLVSRGDLPSGPNDSALLVLTPPVGGAEQQRAQLDAMARRHLGPTLIVLPKWFAMEDRAKPGWVLKLGLIDTQAPAKMLPPDLRIMLTEARGASAPVLGPGQSPAFSEGAHLPFGPVENLHAGRSTVAIPALVDAEQRIVLAEAKSRPVYVLTEPDLLNNQGLASWRTAQSAVAMIDALRDRRGPVVFDVSLNGYSRPRSLLRVLLQPPFLPASLCGLLAAALMGVHAAARFGAWRPPQRAIALGKGALADNAAALIRLAKRRPSMAPRYGAVIRTEAAHALGAARDLPADALDALLDRLSAARATVPFSELTAQARAVRTDAELMESAGSLHRWLKEMTRDPG